MLGARLERRLSPERLQNVRQLLNGAGYYRTTVTGYLGFRALGIIALFALPILFGIASGGIGAVTLVFSMLLGGMGWLIPRMTLQRRAARRLELVDREVPELVDLLVTTVEAGVGFAAALQLAARSVQGPLGEELRLALQEQTMGLTNADALRNMAERIDSAAVRAFIQALLQGEALGVSIGKSCATSPSTCASGAAGRRRSGAEGADEDPLPSDHADPARDVHRHARRVRGLDPADVQDALGRSTRAPELAAKVWVAEPTRLCRAKWSRRLAGRDVDLEPAVLLRPCSREEGELQHGLLEVVVRRHSDTAAVVTGRLRRRNPFPVGPP